MAGSIDECISYTHKISYDKDNITPFELWKNKKPTLNYLIVWRCLAYILTTRYQLKSWDWRHNCAFLGYFQISSAYNFLDLDSNVTIESRDAYIYEEKFVSDKQLLELEDDAEDAK